MVLTAGCAANSASGHSASCTAGSLDPSDTTVYDTTQVNVRPILVTGPDLHYPDRLRIAGIEGHVVLSLVVNSNGRADPASIKAVWPVDPAFVAEAIRYARLASFRPACLNDRAVRVRVRMPVDFRIVGR
jgi:TonB family protein